MVSVLVVLIGYGIRVREKRLKQDDRHQRDLRDAQIRTKQAELSVLRNQMNPHFIFNAHQSIFPDRAYLERMW